MVLDAPFLSTHRFKVRLKGKVERPALHIGVVAIEKGAFKSPSNLLIYPVSKNTTSEIFGSLIFMAYQSLWVI